MTNIQVWLKNFRAFRKARKKNQTPSKKGTPWQVTLEPINIKDGSFTYLDRREPSEQSPSLTFRKLKGHLTGFHWRTPDPSRLTQQVEVSGLFGEHDRTPFEIKGKANFATSQVSFALEGKIKEGALEDQKDLWEGLPIDFTSGTFQLHSKAVCLRKEFNSHNILIFKNFNVQRNRSMQGQLWGIPLVAAINFIQDEQTLTLEVPVRGNIADPQFEFDKAFRWAFQQSLRQNVQSGFDIIRQGSSRLAQGTQELVKKTPQKIARSIEKIPGFSNDEPSESS